MIPGGRYEDIDIVLVRENLEGFYIGFEHYIPIDGDPHAAAISSGVNTRAGSRRIAEFAFDYALKNGRKKVTIVHKANVLKALSGIFLETAREVAKKYEGKVAMDDRIIDACAMQLVLKPWQFDVILTTNLFGDILSDEIAGLVGGLGMAPGANIGLDAAIFEAVHGSAPDIAGKGIANPLALLLAAALMLDHVGHNNAAVKLRGAIDGALRDDGVRTGDLGGRATTYDMTRSFAAFRRHNEMKIRAAVLETMGAAHPYAASRPLKIEQLDLAPPGAGEILVRIKAAGLCHSDLSVINGDRPRPMPMALGHEAAGVVEQLGDGVQDLASAITSCWYSYRAVVTVIHAPKVGRRCVSQARLPTARGPCSMARGG